MFALMWPMALAVVANVLYNITSKAVPADCSPFIMLVFAYLLASLLSLLGYFVLEPHRNIMEEVSNINWTCITLAIAMVGLELGYIYIYRAGWDLSTASLISNVILAVVLLIIGVLFYKEDLNWREYLGITISLAGVIILITAKQ